MGELSVACLGFCNILLQDEESYLLFGKEIELVCMENRLWMVALDHRKLPFEDKVIITVRKITEFG